MRGKGRTSISRFSALCIILLLCSSATAWTGPVELASEKQSVSTRSYLHASSQEDYSSTLILFYENLRDEGVPVEYVCAEQVSEDTVYLHIRMKGTDQITRFYDAEVAALVYAYGEQEYDYNFRVMERVVMEWPEDGRWETRRMYIEKDWIQKYINKEITRGVLVNSILTTDDSYAQPYQPSEKTECYPNDAGELESETVRSSKSEETRQAPPWKRIGGNQTQIYNANITSPTGVVGSLLNATLPIKKYRTVGDDLQIILPNTNQTEARNHARQAALVFANARKQGYNATDRLFIWFPPEKSGPTEFMYIRTKWVDKYLNGTWTKKEYIQKVWNTQEA
ncbi:hypothetical protein [Halorussus salinus]|uniref:hypothetical protein n=1 Tax=Halorussus salinus TaxID=1364935 RepID=UPI0010927002|nr:hypothetical protein [Halorussus salinus]